ncbi:hypothetical protein [Thalassotalea ganghwensis]
MMKFTKTLFGIVTIVVSLGMSATASAQDTELTQSIEATLTAQEVQVKEALEKEIKQSFQQSMHQLALSIKGGDKKVLVASNNLPSNSAFNLTNSED